MCSFSSRPDACVDSAQSLCGCDFGQSGAGWRSEEAQTGEKLIKIMLCYVICYIAFIKNIFYIWRYKLILDTLWCASEQMVNLSVWVLLNNFM